MNNSNDNNDTNNYNELRNLFDRMQQNVDESVSCNCSNCKKEEMTFISEDEVDDFINNKYFEKIDIDMILKAYQDLRELTIRKYAKEAILFGKKHPHLSQPIAAAKVVFGTNTVDIELFEFLWTYLPSETILRKQIAKRLKNPDKYYINYPSDLFNEIDRLIIERINYLRRP